MRVEINFAGDSHDAVLSADEVEKALDSVFRTAAKANVELDEVKITTGQAAESSLNARRIAQSVEQIGQEARRSRRELEQLKLAQAGVGGGFGGLLPGGARPRTAAFGLLGLLAGAVSGPAAGGAVALGAGAAAFGGATVAGIGAIVAAFHGLDKAIAGDRQEFEKLDPSAQQFVQTIRSLIPWLHQVQDITRAGIFPGVEAGLHEALSPENAAAIEKSAGTIAKAVGGIVEQFGQLAGSSRGTQFIEDLGTHGAAQLSTLGDAAVHLADALLTLDHAGQPLADWLAKVIDEGAVLADQWTQQAEASGKLASGAASAQHELALVAKLAGALLNALIALGDDLTPLGNQIISGLTHELQGLADWLGRNHDKVVEITTGALAAFENTLQAIVPLVSELAQLLDAVAEAVGGWDTAFQIVTGGVIANALLRLIGGPESGLAGAEAKSRGLYMNLQNLVKLGTLTIGITTLINGLQTPGVKGFMEQLLGAGAVGWALGGPAGAAASITLDVLYNLIKKPAASGDVTNPQNPDYTYTVGRYKGYGVAVKGKPGDTEIGTLLKWADEGRKLTAAQSRQLLAYIKSHLDDGSFLGFKSLQDALAFYKDSDVYNVASGKHTHPPRNSGTGTSGYDYPLGARGKIIGRPGQGTHSFTQAPNNWESDNAVDIAVKVGTPVVAVEDGTIGKQIGALPGASPGGRFAGLRLHLLGESGNEYYYAHLSKIVVKARQRVRKGETLGFSGSANGVAHLHFASKTGNPMSLVGANVPTATGATATSSGTGTGGSDAFGTPPPLSGSTGADLLPARFRLAIAKASTTPAKTDDRAALKAAIAWLKTAMSGFTGEDEINAYLELASLLNELKGLAPKVKKKAKPAKASAASLISAAGLAATLTSDLNIDPFAGVLPTTPEETQAALTKALANLASVKATYGPKVKQAAAEIKKALTDGTMSAKDLAKLRAQMTQWEKAITDATDKAKTAAANAASAFQQVWQQMAQAALDAFDKTTDAFVSPARQLLNKLQDQHDAQALQDALDQANKDLAAALKGHAEDAQQQLDRIREYVGKQFLANAIDAAQSAVLGGVSSPVSGQAILKTLKDLLVARNVVDPEEVKRAQKEVEEAKYQITIAGLEKTAEAEQTAWEAQRAAQRKVLEQMQADWEWYFLQVGGDIAKIKQLWVDALAAIDPAAAAALQSEGDPGGQGTRKGPLLAGRVVPTARVLQIPGFANGADFVTSGPLAFVAGEGGRPERVTVTPVANGSYGTSTGGVSQVTVVLEGDLAALGDFVKVKAVEATPAIARTQGRMADTRRRGGAY